MARIRVVNKLTGQTGTIPEEKFDPQIFSPVQVSNNQNTQTQPTDPQVNNTQQPVEQTNLLGGILNFGKEAAKSVISPLRFATSGLIQAPVAAVSQGKVNTYNTPLIGGLLGYSNEELKKYAGDVNDSLKTRAGKAGNKALKEGVKATALLASPGMATGLGGKLATLPNAGFQMGALQGAGTYLGEDVNTPAGLVASALTGGILGKVFSSIPKTSQASSDLETEAIKGVNKISTTARPGAGDFKNEAAQTIKELFPKDYLNPYKIEKNSGKVLSDISNKIVENLDDTTPIKNPNSWIQTYRELIANNGVHGADTKAMQSAEKEVLKIIQKEIGNAPTELSTYNAKSAMSKTLSKAFKKATDPLAADLTETEVARLAAWEALNQKISEFGKPTIAKLNQQQNVLYQIAPGIKSAVEGQTPAPFMGSLVNARGLQNAGIEAMGKTAGLTAKLTSPLSNVPESISSRAGGVAGGLGVSALTQPIKQDNIQNNQSAVENPGISELQSFVQNKQTYDQTRGVGDQNRITTDQISQILLDPRLSKQAKTYVKQIYDLQVAQGKAEKDPAAVIQKKASSKNALSKISKLESDYNRNKLARGIATGSLAKLTSGAQRDPQVTAYLSTRDGYAPTIAKALGDVGNLADKEQERAIKLIPDVSDTPETAALKWQYLKELVTYYE